MNEADIASEYRESMKEKASIARSAGRERAACGMKTDMIPTKREYESKCGEVMVYNYNRPMTWSEFKAWDAAHRKEYLEFVSNRYKVGGHYLANMFCVSAQSVNLEVKSVDAKIYRRQGAKNKGEAAEWDAFLAKKVTDTKPTEKEAVNDIQPIEKKEGKTVEENQFKLTVNSGEVEAHGKTAEVMPKLVTYLGGILPKSVKVKIIWEVEE